MIIQSIQSIFQIFIILALAPLLSGIMKKVKAFFQIRKGAGIMQSYYDIIKLLKKDSVVSENVSWIFHTVMIRLDFIKI